ncbi:Coiled-coil domain-containing hypothatical protein [Phytophthora megakarya]|uniref:Coiled-coil domain-containing hypothatical protein n=1 Tax=Phytophthora megakarya TaxID=4795 RepID=A0A225W9D7_9STRA|nr:Coiled-coil domain-containing hypothatical protein [Phytophthora megakarya]
MSETIEDEDDRLRRQRYEDTERELLAVLEADTVDESTRKRKLVGLFDRFRIEYTQLSVKLRENLRLQRRLMDKCLQMKNELVVCALKIKTAEQVHADEIKSLVFYRDECEYAWKQSALSQERERDAMRIIDDLKLMVEELQSQVKTLMANGSSSPSTRRRPHTEGTPHLPFPASMNSPRLPARILSPVLSPTGTSNSPAKRTKLQLNGSSDSFTMPTLPSFDEWKSATNVWCPTKPLALGGSTRVALTPSQDAIRSSDRQQEISRCVSVPSLHPTPMERVNSPQHQQRPKPERLNSPGTIHVRAATAPALAPVRASLQLSDATPIRRGGTPAIKRRVPRQLPHVQ